MRSRPTHASVRARRHRTAPSRPSCGGRRSPRAGSGMAPARTGRPSWCLLRLELGELLAEDLAKLVEAAGAHAVADCLLEPAHLPSIGRAMFTAEPSIAAGVLMCEGRFGLFLGHDG